MVKIRHTINLIEFLQDHLVQFVYKRQKKIHGKYKTSRIFKGNISSKIHEFEKKYPKKRYWMVYKILISIVLYRWNTLDYLLPFIIISLGS